MKFVLILRERNLLCCCGFFLSRLALLFSDQVQADVRRLRAPISSRNYKCAILIRSSGAIIKRVINESSICLQTLRSLSDAGAIRGSALIDNKERERERREPKYTDTLRVTNRKEKK